MTTYKKIVENMVDSEVHSYVEKRVGGYVAYPESVKLELDKEFGHPTFEAEIHVSHRTYTVRGYISEYGIVNVCSVSFERDLVIDDNRSDWWAKDNVRHESECLWGDKLVGFKFDR